jgi:hypothetical protein
VTDALSCPYCFGPHLEADCPNITPVNGTPVAGALTVEQIGPGRFRVTGGSEPHVVDLTAATAFCDCPDRRFRHRPCKHLAAVDRYLEARQS